MTKPQGDWKKQCLHLVTKTPLTEEQASVLALIKTDHSEEEISDILSISTDEVEARRESILDEWDRAELLCSLMGPHPWGDENERPARDIDDSPWTLQSSASMTYSDEERTRVELELYRGGSNPGGTNYLLVEREIKDETRWATTTTEKRSAHGQYGLRDYIYNDVERIDEFYLRWSLLARGGVDPGAEGTPRLEQLLGRETTDLEENEFEEQAMEKAERHVAERYEVYNENYPQLPR